MKFVKKQKKKQKKLSAVEPGQSGEFKSKWKKNIKKKQTNKTIEQFHKKRRHPPWFTGK